MQRANITLRLGGSLLHTVAKRDVTPGEILVLQHIHGADAVQDVRPTKFDPNVRHEAEYERLRGLYDRTATFTARPGEDDASIMSRLFPGAVKKLPTTLGEIGMGQFENPDDSQAEASIEPEEPELAADEIDEAQQTADNAGADAATAEAVSEGEQTTASPAAFEGAASSFGGFGGNPAG